MWVITEIPRNCQVGSLLTQTNVLINILPYFPDSNPLLLSDKMRV